MTERHTHTASCKNKVVVCRLQERPSHQHVDSCYEGGVNRNDPFQSIVCDLYGHTHTESQGCYYTRYTCGH